MAYKFNMVNQLVIGAMMKVSQALTDQFQEVSAKHQLFNQGS
jgi:hypothetical protein